MNPDELLSLIKNRRSIRSWTDNPVEEEKIQKILTAGIYAPSGANCQKVKFYVMNDKEAIEEVAKNTSPWFFKSYPDKIIVVLFDLLKKDPLAINYKKIHPYWFRLIWQDSAAAIMNMILMAESLGLKTCWVSVRPPSNGAMYENKIRKLLHISNRFVITSFLFLGYSNVSIDIDTYLHQKCFVKRDEEEPVIKKFDERDCINYPNGIPYEIIPILLNRIGYALQHPLKMARKMLGKILPKP